MPGVVYGAAFLPLVVRTIVETGVNVSSVLIWIFSLKSRADNGRLNKESTEFVFKDRYLRVLN